MNYRFNDRWNCALFCRRSSCSWNKSELHEKTVISTRLLSDRPQKCSTAAEFEKLLSNRCNYLQSAVSGRRRGWKDNISPAFNRERLAHTVQYILYTRMCFTWLCQCVLIWDLVHVEMLFDKFSDWMVVVFFPILVVIIKV